MELIDLGLPSETKWASCNIGANKPTESGGFFAWGDTCTKSIYVGRTCETYDLDIISLKMEDYVNSRNVLSTNYDAATHILGDGWRIPSGEQAQELIDNCNWEWVTNYENTGINGRLGVSKNNGASIFLPAAGYAQSSNHLMVGDNGGYWTSSPNMVASNRAWSIAFDSNVINVFDHGLRYYGYSIRPVYKESEQHHNRPLTTNSTNHDVWHVKEVRQFGPEEIAAVKSAKVVSSKYGKSVCFFLQSGEQRYLPLSVNSKLCVGDTFDLSLGKVLTLSREGYNDIIRVEE